MNKYLTLLLFVVFWSPFNSCFAREKQGQAYADTLFTQLAKSSPDTNKVHLLNELSNTYLNINLKIGMQYAKEANELAQKLKWESGIAYANLNLIFYYTLKSDYSSALKNGVLVLNQFQSLGDKKGMAKTYIRIAKAQNLQGNYPDALNNCFHALSLFESLGNQQGIADAYIAIALIYSLQSNHSEALDLCFKALLINEKMEDKTALSKTYNVMGNCYYNLKDYPNSLKYWKQALVINQKLGDTIRIGGELDNIGWSYYKMSNFPQALKYLYESLSFSKVNLSETLAWDFVGLGGTYLAIAKDSSKKSLNDLFNGDKKAALIKSKLYTDSALFVSESSNHLESLLEGYQQLSEIQSLLGDYKEALASFKKYSQKTNDVYGRTNSANIASIKIKYNQEKIDAQKNAEMERQKLIRNLISLGFGIVVLFLIVIYRQRNRIIKEKDRSNNLLLNILPADIAEELKIHGKAEARDFEMASIIFTDFIAFTQTAEKLTAKELVSEISACFEAFDGICKKHKVEKIKTIGDAYMAVAGLPIPSGDSVKNALLAAIEMQEFISNRKKENEALGKAAFEMRAGVHTGPVVAGIVGVNKFQYDIWGDAVNTASRIESHGEVGKVNISKSTYQLIKNDSNFQFEARGKINAKGKGEMEMYFVNAAQTD